MTEAFPVGPVVLGYLLSGGEAHGYELLSRFHEDLGRIWRVAPSQLYFTLSLLERQGFISGKKEPQETRPPRTRYALTEKGQEEFWKWALSPVPRLRLLRSHFLPKLFFLLKLAPERLPELLSAQRETLLSLKAQVEEEKPADKFQEMLRSFRLSQLEAALQWIAEISEKEGS
ncbi:PadR family transcriptional regulator [Candidatus Bipolaricaulota bacterium]|nr:PadR family transcriptional regulator [Candidatus Bipolaricaulota bacterium]